MESADRPERGFDLELPNAGELRLAFMRQQATEHNAWLMVVAELRRAGVADIERGGRHERLHDTIVLWAEELAQLRLADPEPEHAARALAERRAKWAADWEGR